MCSSDLRFFHFMGASNVSGLALLTAGSATYSSVAGFTKPINEVGQVGGTVNSLNVSVIFGANPRITAYNLGLTDAGGRNWTAALTGTQLLTDFAPGGSSGNNLSATCTGCAGLSPITGAGKARGYVIGGANRDALLSSYGLSAGSATVTGSVVVK